MVVEVEMVVVAEGEGEGEGGKGEEIGGGRRHIYPKPHCWFL